MWNRTMSYEEITVYLKNLPPFIPGKNVFRLDTMQALMRRLGDPQNALEIVHFTGSNGKGSSLNFLYTILCESGVRAGSFTSPYLQNYEEMIRLGGQNITREDFCRFFSRVLEACKEDIQASEFELFTALAFLYFREQGCELLLLEVGLGGRLDATNVISYSRISVCTVVDFDHMQILGDTLEDIAREKAGIIKENSVFVTLSQDETVKALFQRISRERNTQFYEAAAPKNIRVQDVYITMRGEHQSENAALALQLAHILQRDFKGITEDSMRRGLEKVEWPGRFTLLQRKPRIFVDGAHNVAGIRTLCRSLRSMFGERKIHFIVGVLEDKDYKGMMQELYPMAEAFYTLIPPTPRALPAQKLQTCIQKEGIRAYDLGSLGESLDTLLKNLQEEDLVFILGSLYQVREAYQYFGKAL